MDRTKQKREKIPVTLEGWIAEFGDDFGFLPISDPTPTHYAPGSAQKAKLLCDRANRGEPLFVHGDRVLLKGCDRFSEKSDSGLCWTGSYSSGAEYSSCRKFRYRLWRQWKEVGPRPVFIGLYPGRGTETEFDDVLHQINAFCLKEGCAGFEVLNLFARRAHSFDEVMDSEDPFGPHNNRALRIQSTLGSYVLCHWGVYGCYEDRSSEVLWALRKKMSESRFHCFGLTPLRPSFTTPGLNVGQPVSIEDVSLDAVTIPLPFEMMDIATDQDFSFGELASDGAQDESISDISGSDVWGCRL